MTDSPANVAAQQRMTPDDYAVTTIARDFAERGPLAFESFLSGYYAESIRIIRDAHVTDCTAGHGDPCATCEAIRGGLTGIHAEQRATDPKAAS